MTSTRKAITYSALAGFLTGMALAALAPGCGLRTRPGRLAWMIAGQACDLVSTELALSAGGRELNPLMRNRGIHWSTKLALPFTEFGKAPESAPDPTLLKQKAATAVAMAGFVPCGLNLVQYGVAKHDRR